MANEPESSQKTAREPDNAPAEADVSQDLDASAEDIDKVKGGYKESDPCSGGPVTKKAK